jgi:8-amino-7-oxononanoate synthase
LPALPPFTLFSPHLTNFSHSTQLINHLLSLISHLHTQLRTIIPLTYQNLQIPLSKPKSPIFSLLSPEPRSLAKHCQEAGLMVRAIVPPTVPEGTQRVRVCLHAGNTLEDIDRLVASIKDWLELQNTVRQDLTVEFEKAML